MTIGAPHTLLATILTGSTFLATTSYTQVMDTGSIFSQPVSMDSFVVKSGFDINAFIRRVKNDTTFYKAFRSMHLVPFTAQNNIEVYHKQKNSLIASEYCITQQDIKNNCRSTKITEQVTTGNYNKRNGEYNYYTASLFHYLFIPQSIICNEDDIVAGKMNLPAKSKLEKNKEELKQLIFNPGSKVSGVPFMADRASIFDADEAKKYNFNITQSTYQGQECYVFRITPKKVYEHKVLYNELTTWFRKGDYCILSRHYSLSYSTLLYDFDVIMNVNTTIINDKLYPVHITYNGNWHVFTQKRERVRFDVKINY